MSQFLDSLAVEKTPVLGIVKTSFDSYQALYEDIKANCARVEKKYGKLNTEKIKQIYIEWKQTKNKSLHDALVYSQIKWAMSLAMNKYYRLGDLYKDQLISIAFESVLKAIDTFNPELGTLPTWFRGIFNTNVIAFGKEVGVYFSQTDEDNRIKVISANVSLGEEGEGEELLDTLCDESTKDPIPDSVMLTEEVAEILASLPLRDREIITLVFLKNVKVATELGEMLTPITDVEYTKVRERGHNVLSLSFNYNDVNYSFIYNINSYYHNKDKNTNPINYPNGITCKTHTYENINKVVKRDMLVMNGKLKNIAVKFNGEKIPFLYKNDTLSIPLEYNYGAIFVDGTHALQSVKRKLRTHPQILKLKNIYNN